jgi:hypothetical protein
MSRALRAHFADWVRQLEIPGPGAVADRLLRLDPDGYFLNFNYTPTLERLYGVAPQKILYIHGAASRPTDEIVLGHGWRRSDADSLNYRIDRESADFRLIEGNHIIDRYFAETFKPVDDIITRNAATWATYRTTTDVFVLGHSLAAVDHPYLTQVCSLLRLAVQIVDRNAGVADMAAHGPCPLVNFFQFRRLGLRCQISEVITKQVLCGITCICTTRLD